MHLVTLKDITQMSEDYIFVKTIEVAVNESMGEICVFVKVWPDIPIFSWFIAKWYQRKIGRRLREGLPVGIKFNVIMGGA